MSFPRKSRAPHLSQGPGGLAGEIFGLRQDTADAIDDIPSMIAQPTANVQAAGYAFVATDVGNTVFATGAGAQAFTLPDLSAALVPGGTLLLTIQCTGSATAVTITPGAASQIDNAGVAVAFVAAVGRTRISLMSKDGLNWYSGA